MPQEDTTLFETIGAKGQAQSDPRGPEIVVYPYTYYPKGTSPGTPPVYEGLNVTVTIQPANLYFFARSYLDIGIGGVIVARVFADIAPRVLQPGYACSVHVLPGFPDRRVIVEDTNKAITYSFDFTRLRGPENPKPFDSTANALIVTSPSTGSTVQSSNSDVEPIPNGSTPILSMQGKHYLFVKSTEFSPTIRISSVSAARNKNFGEMFATVVNTEKYTGTYDGTSTQVLPGVWESQFCEFPQFNTVLKGKGYTLEQKFLSIISHYNLDTDLNTFTGQMALYAYTRYVLSRFLFGDFDICYLTQQYTREFFRRLQESEFSQFAIVFGPKYGLVGFDKYFHRKCKQC